MKTWKRLSIIQIESLQLTFIATRLDFFLVQDLWNRLVKDRENTTVSKIQQFSISVFVTFNFFDEDDIQKSMFLLVKESMTNSISSCSKTLQDLHLPNTNLKLLSFFGNHKTCLFLKCVFCF